MLFSFPWLWNAENGMFTPISASFCIRFVTEPQSATRHPTVLPRSSLVVLELTEFGRCYGLASCDCCLYSEGPESCRLNSKGDLINYLVFGLQTQRLIRTGNQCGWSKPSEELVTIEESPYTQPQPIIYTEEYMSSNTRSSNCSPGGAKTGLFVGNLLISLGQN